MILICYGMPKSASTFAYQMAIGLVEAAGHIQDEIAAQLPPGLQNSFFDEYELDLEALIAAVPKHTIRVIKTHARIESLGPALFSDDVKAIVTARDPREAVLSVMETAERELREKRTVGTGFTQFAEFDEANTFIRNQVIFTLDWWKRREFLCIPYRELALQPHRAAERMREYLGLQVNSAAVADYFLEDKTRIVEFATGQMGRFREHFSQEQLAVMTYEKQMEQGIVFFS